MRHRSRPSIASILALAGATLAASACSDPGGGASSTASARPPLAGASTSASAANALSRPAWATTDRLVGRVGASERLELQVHLRMRDEQGAAAELRAISDPHSPRFGRFLTDDEYLARFAPGDADLAAVRAHLESNGLRVTRVADDRSFLVVEGTAAQAEQAFATHLGLYTVQGATRRAPIEAPTLPAAVAPHVVAVLGLSTPRSLTPRNVVVGGLSADPLSPDATTRICSAYYGAKQDTTDPALGGGYPDPLPYVPCGFTPPQIRRAYGLDRAVDAGLDGTGRKVAIVDAYMSPTLLADAQAYAAAHDPNHPLASSQFSEQWGPGTPTPVDKGWYGEQTLDVEAVHAVAPGANIVFIGAQSANDQDLIAAINLVVTQHLASIVSNSYGETEQGETNLFDAWHAVATQAGLKGIGLYFASGDDGDETDNLGYASADFPASLDNATAVGGTSLTVDESGHRLWETGWETGETRLQAQGDAGAEAWTPAAPGSWVYGSGGGVSVQYKQPWYQWGTVPRALAEANGASWRVVPDVSMVGDPVTGFLVGQTSSRSGNYGEGVIGGTSLATPLFSATMALGEQLAGRRFGFANPLLYLAAQNLGGLRDVRPLESRQAVALRAGVVATFDDDATQAIHVTRGYDDVTGIGSPRGFEFLASLLP